ncbi:MAG: sensor histidine kinase, partial [Bryobacteraceae bacterium]
MRKRVLYGSGVVLLAVLVGLIVWQVSFTFPETPEDLSQTFLFWAVSTLVFVLTVTLGFILFRTGVKLYIERRKNREGSRIKSKLFFGALALSFMPVCFLVFYSYGMLNRTLDKWFVRPAEQVGLEYITVGRTIKRQLEERLGVQAALLEAAPEMQAGATGDFLDRFCRDQRLESAEVWRGTTLVAEGMGPVPGGAPADSVTVRRSAGDLELRLKARVPMDVSSAEGRIISYLRWIDKLHAEKKDFRSFSILMQLLIALFTLFVTTWIALFLAKQISVPISALLRGANQVREGNLGHRVEVGAIDELGTLVHAFNQMTAQLEANRGELEARRRFTEAILESIPTGVISLAGDGTILRVNRALRTIFPEEAVARARRLEDLFSRDDTAEIKYLMKRARRAGSASREMELKTERQTLPLSVTVSALEDKAGSAFVIVLEDLSDLLRAQKAAAWHEVARRVAHEIKNPLTPIGLSAERVGRQLDRLELPADVRRIVGECTATIISEVESVKALVDEFSQFARFPAAQLARGDLNEVVDNGLAAFAGRLDGIAIRSDLASGLPAVSIDREQFKRVIVNLVDNAAEAMQDAPLKELYIT